jgi:hypothetical protein
MRDKTQPPAPALSAPSADVRQLPLRVAALRLRILAAAASHDIEQLRIPIEWNEVPPLLSRAAHASAATDPIKLLRTLSYDGSGAEILSIAKAVFEAPYIVQTTAGWVNYIWPSYALVPPEHPSAEEQLAMWRCVRFADLARVSPQNRLPLYRAAIGRDGTWHYFWAEG